LAIVTVFAYAKQLSRTLPGELMKHRERVLAAIRHEVPDRIPIDAIKVENTAAVAAFLGIPENEVIDHLGLDGRLVGVGYKKEARRLDLEANRNEWGALGGAEYGSAHAYPLSHITSIGDVERYNWPEPAHYDYPSAAESAKTLAVEYAVRGPYWQPLFCRVCSLAGMETALIWMATESKLFEAMLDAVFERTYALCKEYIDQCGDHLDILCLGDDFASQRGMLFSPDLWRRYLKPRYAKLFELGRAANKFIWFHSCGDVTAVLPDLIDIGMDVWETVQLHTLPLSSEDLKREYGKHITFFGAVSTQCLPFSTAHEVSNQVNRCIDALGEGGGYICGPDHHIKPDVPAANTVALFETARQYEAQGYILDRDK
jgi:uroporphyrinogen decarboxylase